MDDKTEIPHGEQKNKTITESITRPYKGISLPPEFNHFTKHFESPLADNTVERIRERIGNDTDKVTILDLQQIISSEIFDINDQQEMFEESEIDKNISIDLKENIKNWREQKLLIQKVEKYFMKNADINIIDVTPEQLSDGSKKYKLGKENGVYHTTFDRQNLPLIKAKINSFASQISTLKKLQETTLAMITDPTSKIDGDDKAQLSKYIENQLDRWTENANSHNSDSEEFKSAKANSNIFGKFYEFINPPHKSTEPAKTHDDIKKGQKNNEAHVGKIIIPTHFKPTRPHFHEKIKRIPFIPEKNQNPN